MWHLLVVLALCGASLVQGEQQWSSCNNVTTVQNVSLTEFQGTWVARNSFINEKQDREEKVCLLNEIVADSDNKLTMILKYHAALKNGDKEVHTVRMRYNVSEDNMGRWRYEQRMGHQMHIVSVDPTNYLVMAMCRPSRRRQEENVGEHFVLTEVVFYARRQGGGEENLAKILDDTIKTLGLQNYNQEEFNYSEC